MRPRYPAISGMVSLLIFILSATDAFAASVDVPSVDGWYRWDTIADATTARACCHEWLNGEVTPCVCYLDEPDRDMSFNGTLLAKGHDIRVYVKISNAAVSKVRALSTACPVKTGTEITDLGNFASADSIRWLASQLPSGGNIAEHSLNAIALHGGDEGFRALVSVLENRSFRKNLREHALFWIAQSGSDLAFEYLDKLLSAR